VKARGGDVRIVYSPLDAVELAREHPTREVVFFAVGFETTAPANAMAVFQAARAGCPTSASSCRTCWCRRRWRPFWVGGQPRAGLPGRRPCLHHHGLQEYEPLAAKYHVPIVVTGFEPLDILQGVFMCVKQLEEGRAEVENQYARAVRREGNVPAQQLVREVFEVVPRKWRGVGEIPASGLGLRPAYQQFDAERRFGLADSEPTSRPSA
jgi:hydrogenase expression/formation protein HypD